MSNLESKNVSKLRISHVTMTMSLHWRKGVGLPSVEAPQKLTEADKVGEVGGTVIKLQ